MVKHSSSGSRPLVAGITAALTMLAALAPAFAQNLPYEDVPPGAYYEEAADALLQSGALEHMRFLRPGDLATRAEVVKLLVRVHDQPLVYPATSSFNDVSRAAWYFSYFEAAAQAGWVKGDSACYKSFRPCTARPPANLNRAEAAALLTRAFGLEKLNLAPRFSDVPTYEWYSDPIQTAADHCILQGDELSSRVRPASFMNRAEMIVMFHRATQHQQYGRDCGVLQPEGRISSVTVVSADKIRLTFNVDLDEARAELATRYRIESTVDGENVDIDNAVMTSARTIELKLGENLQSGRSYSIDAESLRTSGGFTFSARSTFTYSSQTIPEISRVSVLTPTRLRLTFSDALEPGRAQDVDNYALETSNGSMGIAIASATFIDDTVVELSLRSALELDTSYRLTASGLRTADGVTFTDSIIFPNNALSPSIESIQTQSATRVRATFNADLDPNQAEDAARYAVTGAGVNIPVATARMVTNRSVDLYLQSSLQSQRPYVLHATGLRTAGGTVFSGTGAFVFDTNNVNFHSTLRGIEEVPPTSSIATGSGIFILAADGLHYDLTVQNLTGPIIGAHFHQGNMGVNGSVIFTIPFTGNRAIGTWTGLTAQQRDQFLNEGIYVNVHTDIYPNGEIRGQVRLGS